MARHIFVSYVRENSEAIDRLVKQLESHGLTVWLDRTKISPGMRWRDAVRDAIRSGDLFVACFSAASATKERSYMNEELTLAIEELRQRPTDRTWFVPVLLDGGVVPQRTISATETLRDLQWINLGTDWELGVNAVIRAAFAKVTNNPIEAPERMTMEHVRELVGQLDAADLKELSPGAQFMAKAVFDSKSDEDSVIALRKNFHLLSTTEQREIVKAAFDDPSVVLAPIRRLINELPEETQQEILDERQFKRATVFDNDITSELRRLLAGGPDLRRRLYCFFKSDTMLALLKGPHGVFLYEEIISLAVDAGAPMDEVRAELIPLVGEERIDALVNQLVSKFLGSGGLERALNKSLAEMKLETERKRQFLALFEDVWPPE
jgi:hypothetical protein